MRDAGDEELSPLGEKGRSERCDPGGNRRVAMMTARAPAPVPSKPKLPATAWIAAVVARVAVWIVVFVPTKREAAVSMF